MQANGSTAEKIFQDRLHATPHATDRSFGDYLRSLREGKHEYLKDRYGSTMKVALSGSSGATGGYVIPTDFAEGIWGVAAEESVFLQHAFQVPLTSRSVQIPVIRYSGSGSAGQSPFFGGVRFRWGEEAATRDETEPTFAQVKLEAHELQGYAKISNPLLEDGNYGRMATYLSQLFGKSCAWYLDYACFTGDGVGKPLGILNAPCALTVSRNTSTDWKIQDAAGMSAKMIPVGWRTARWSMNPSVLAKHVLLGDNAGGAVSTNFPNPSPGWTLYTCPVDITEKTPVLGTRGDVMFWVPELYALGIRPEIEIAFSAHVPDPYLANQSVFRVVMRADGQPLPEASVTLADGSTTSSPIVILV